MSSEYDTDRRNGVARKKLEALLSPTYSSATKTGWVEPDFSMAEVFTRYPRRRGNMITNLLHKALGRQNERYYEATRFAHLGRLPEDWFGNPVPPRMTVEDTVYTPIDPADGINEPLRRTSAIFITSAGSDVEGYWHEAGISIRFLERERLAMHIGSHHRGRFPNIKVIQNQLSEHDLPLLYSSEAREQSTRLIDYCIADALRAENE